MTPVATASRLPDALRRAAARLLGALRRFLGIDPPLPVGPRPAGWDRTLADLGKENRSLSREEIEWARQYELDQLRAWARFPKDGDEYVSTQDRTVSFLVYWKAPYTTGGEGLMPSGTRIRVSVHPQDPEPVGVQACPVDYAAFELRWVAAIDRGSAKYAGYGLTFTVGELNRDFVLVRDAGGASAA